MEIFSCIAIIITFLIDYGETFPNSVPTAACIDMLPGHTPTNLVVINPYRITVSQDSYQVNGQLAVTVTSIDGQTVGFKGILLLARSIDTGDIIGTWEPPTTDGLGTLSCSATNDGITHVDRRIKTTPVTFMWNAPGYDAGAIVFRVTVVQDYGIFWVALSSDIIRRSGTDVCLARPCNNGGDCQNDAFSPGGFRCLCRPGYQGTTCELLPGAISACDPNPCRNEGQCFENGKCACSVRYFGNICRLNAPRKVFCFRNTCQNGGLCVVDEATSQDICVCPKDYDGTSCEIKVGLGLCEGIDCGTGECYEDETTQNGYYCRCPRTHTGTRCQASACRSDPCRNGGLCSLSATVESGFLCTCPANFYGPTCQSIVGGPCASNPCGTNVICTEFPTTNSYECGSVCSSLPCFNSGTCVHRVSSSGFICDCPVGFIGDDCRVQDVCSSFPCYNGGTCYKDSQSLSGYSCRCPQTFQGARCQNINHCYPNPCLNSGRCEESSSSETRHVCTCVNGFVGADCGTLPPPIDFCNPNQCLNNGQCVSEVDTFRCICLDGYSGVLCQIPTPIVTGIPTLPPVTLPPGVTLDPAVCAVNQCQNGGECYADDAALGGFSCKCDEIYYGPLCELEYTLCELFDPCKNNGVCIDATRSCLCDLSYRGPVCQFPVSANCSIGLDLCPYGECKESPDGLYTCVCQQGGSGLNCEFKDPCDPDPCGPQGTCRGLADGEFKCDCESGFFGKTCEEKSDDGFKEFLELLFTYWPIALGIIVLIITIIICWIGCHFTKEDKKRRKAAGGGATSRAARNVRKGRKKKGRRGSDDSDIDLEGTYQI